MSHIRVKEAEDILGDRFGVLDEGYVRLVDYMGGDQRILDIARECYGPNASKEDRLLMGSIMGKRDKDILGMVELKLHFEMPIADAMAFVYERNANVNEFSLRYSVAQDSFNHLSLEELKIVARAGINEDELKRLAEETKAFAKRSFERYEWAMNEERDIAKEIARTALGSNLYTRFYWKINLADLLDFTVRTHYGQPTYGSDAYLKSILNIVHRVAPLTIRSYLSRENLTHLIEEKEPNVRPEPRISHNTSKEAEDLLDKRLSVLENGGVTLVDYMGNDKAVLNAARISTGRDDVIKNKKTQAQDTGLINYLMRNKHTTPFEMIEFLWKVDVPLLVYRQGGRHRTFERVVCDSNALGFYHPLFENIAAQSKKNHQGRGDVVNEQLCRDFLKNLDDNEAEANGLYKKYTDLGIPHIIAKRHVPVNGNITHYFKSDLHNAVHYLGLRLDSHTQLETRKVAEAMAFGVKAVAPESYRAFEKYRLNALTITETEIPILKAILEGGNAESTYPGSWLEKSALGELKTNREREEFEAKLKKLRGD